MINQLVKTPQQITRLVWFFSLVLLVCLGAAIYLERLILLAVPVLFLFFLIVLTDYRWLYYLLLISLPFSFEIDLPSGFSLYLPTEPLVLALVACGLGSWVQGSFSWPARYQWHPLWLLLFLFFGWTLFTSLYSVDKLKSFKYLVAQVCYAGVFLFLTFFFVKKATDVNNIWRIFLLSLMAVLLLVFFRHANLGFSFDGVNQAVQPFFMNHVIYAVTAGYALPLVIYLLWLNKNSKWRWFWFVGFILVLLAVIFSYTRATWLAVIALGVYYLIIKKRWMRPVLLLVSLVVVIGFSYLVNKNRYLIYAPEYEKTIFNKGDIGKHLEATYKLEDVSGMERVYRWVAAIRLAYDKPYTGSGPSTFYPEYKKYTVKSFRTYVSDNPERSTAHNYFLLQMAEQGYIGGIILIALIFYLLIWPETLYHRTQNPTYKAMILAAGACLFIIIFHLLLNELLGLDKSNSFFFICMAILLRLDFWIRDEKQVSALQEK